MIELTPADRLALIEDIAFRRGNARELAEKYATTVEDLKKFTTDNKLIIKLAKKSFEEEQEKLNAQVTPTQLSELWIAKKFDRLLRYQIIAESLYEEIMDGSRDAAVLREFRSFCLAASNELGQLLHRGAGESADGDTASYEIKGANLQRLM